MANTDQEMPSNQERRLLLRATVTVGTVAGVASAVPFIASMAPSERALSEGAAVEVDVSSIPAGNMVSVAWRGKPVWVLHRTQAMIESLQQKTDMLSDPQSARSEQPENAHNPLRSLKPQFGVLVGICTHLGCVPLYRPEIAPADLGESWQGGFYCPCHGSKFDLAGRVFKNVPAPTNLVVPPYAYRTDDVLIVGEQTT